MILYRPPQGGPGKPWETPWETPWVELPETRGQKVGRTGICDLGPPLRSIFMHNSTGIWILVGALFDNFCVFRGVRCPKTLLNAWF